MFVSGWCPGADADLLCAADRRGGVPASLGFETLGMTNTAIIRDAYGVPAIFVGSKTGRDDAPFVFVRVGDEERRMRWSEWDALPAWTGARPSWAGKQK